MLNLLGIGVRLLHHQHLLLLQVRDLHELINAMVGVNSIIGSKVDMFRNMGEGFKYFDKFVIKGYDEKGKQMNKWDQYHKVPLMQVPF